MSIIQFKGYRAKDISFHGDLPVGTTVSLENQYSFNVRYNGNGLCFADLTCHVYDKDHKEDFFLNLQIEGVFAYDKEVPREQIHVQIYKELFPYARALASTVTATAGIPPIILPAADIEKQNILRVDPSGLMR